MGDSRGRGIKMSEWYLIFGFNSENELIDYKEDVREWRKKHNPINGTGMDSLLGENLGVHLLNLDRMEDFDLSCNDDIEEFPYYVFWKLEVGFSVGYGFHAKEDMQSEE